MFYSTAVGGSVQYPQGDKDVVYVRYPGCTDWNVLSEAMAEVSKGMNERDISMVYI